MSVTRTVVKKGETSQVSVFKRLTLSTTEREEKKAPFVITEKGPTSEIFSWLVDNKKSLPKIGGVFDWLKFVGTESKYETLEKNSRQGKRQKRHFQAASNQVSLNEHIYKHPGGKRLWAAEDGKKELSH